MSHKPLLSRLKYTGRPFLKLNNSQQIALDRFQQKCNTKEYSFESVPCICGSSPDDSLLIAEQDRYGLSVDTFFCYECGTLWTSPRLTAISLQKFYEQDYRSIYSGSQIATDHFFDNQVKQGRRIKDFVDSYWKSLDTHIVFDIGCGAGGTLLPFVEDGWAAYGCDLGDEYLKYGQERGLSLLQGDATVLMQFGKADMIIASHILEHLPDPSAELKIWRDLLVDRGYLYIELPGVLSSYEFYGDFAGFLQNAHLHHFTLDTLTYLLNQAGFSLVKGDETIYALFIKSEQSQQTRRGDAKNIIQYLKTSEKKRPRIRIKRFLLRLLGLGKLLFSIQAWQRLCYRVQSR